MKVGVRSSGRPVAVLTALTAVLVLSLSVLASSAGAELITPHAATPETVTPQVVTPAPAPAAAPEAVPAPEAEYEESSEAPSTEAEGQSQTKKKQNRRGDSDRVDPNSLPLTPDEESGKTEPWWTRGLNAPSCGISCWQDTVGSMDSILRGSFPLADPIWVDWATVEEITRKAIALVLINHIKTDATVRLLNAGADVPQAPTTPDPAKDSTDDSGQSKADAPVDNPFDTHDGPGKDQCRGQGNTSDTNDQVEDGKSGSNVCR
jgi:hypothetical protein